MIVILEGKNLIHPIGRSSVLLTAKDGPQDLGKELEAQLIQAGVAKAVNIEPPVKKVITPQPPPVGDNNDGEDEIGNSNEPPTYPYYNEDMKADELRALMKTFEVPVKAGMSKVAMVAALNAKFKPQPEESDDGEQPPELGAEDIVQ